MFGASSSAASSSIFGGPFGGASNAFGNAQTAQTNNIFGFGNASTTLSFGQPATFGNTQPNTFISPGSSNQTSTAPNLFGSSNQIGAAPNLFGSSNQTSTGPNLFGSSNQTGTAPNLFGSSGNQFGNAQPNTGSSIFGNLSTLGQTTLGNTQASSSSNLLGNTNPSFGNASTLFGNTQTGMSSNLLGNTSAAFGNASASTGFSPFPNTLTNTSSSLFGSQQPNSGISLFGNTQNNSGTSIFGSTPTNTLSSIFAPNNQSTSSLLNNTLSNLNTSLNKQPIGNTSSIFGYGLGSSPIVGGSQSSLLTNPMQGIGSNVLGGLGTTSLTGLGSGSPGQLLSTSLLNQNSYSKISSSGMPILGGLQQPQDSSAYLPANPTLQQATVFIPEWKNKFELIEEKLLNQETEMNNMKQSFSLLKTLNETVQQSHENELSSIHSIGSINLHIEHALIEIQSDFALAKQTTHQIQKLYEQFLYNNEFIRQENNIRLREFNVHPIQVPTHLTARFYQDLLVLVETYSRDLITLQDNVELMKERFDLNSTSLIEQVMGDHSHLLSILTEKFTHLRDRLVLLRTFMEKNGFQLPPIETDNNFLFSMSKDKDTDKSSGQPTTSQSMKAIQPQFKYS